jgi:hypothetical protein
VQGSYFIDHDWNIEFIKPLREQCSADKTPALLSHEIYQPWRYFLGGDNEIALIFTTFIVNHDDGFTLFYILYGLFNAG